ncbi:MAG: tetratricopeptide repeat protein [Chloroflexi bacterium]|nr:tetratricopeptide repeat protein [Chloroflexota bacterium]
MLTLERWLEALPAERLEASPLLTTYRAWVFTLVGDPVRASQLAGSMAENLIKAGQEQPQALLSLRAFLAVLHKQNYEEAIQLATMTLSVPDAESDPWRYAALWVLAEAQERTRPIDEAIATLREATRSAPRRVSPIFRLMIHHNLAVDLNLSGRRSEALRQCLEALEDYRDDEGNTRPGGVVLLSRLASLYYEANQLNEARALHEQSLALAERLALPGTTLFIAGAAAQTFLALGETERAMRLIEQAHQSSKYSLVGDSWIQALETLLRLRQGDHSLLQPWIQAAGYGPDSTPDYIQIEEHLTYARAMLATGEDEAAHDWLSQLEAFTRERSLQRWLLTTSILQAMLAERQRDRARTRQMQARAVRIAAPEQYIRAFLDEGEPLLRLLPTVRQEAPIFVDTVLDMADLDENAWLLSAQPLDEPLSERELEVMQLITDGLSNKEIADRLVIAVSTVKRHINNVYGKLNAQSRAQAIAKARSLGLVR